MAAPDPNVITRIKKLLSLSKNNPNVQEASAAAAKAEHLMREHQLAMADIIIDQLRGPQIHDHMGRAKVHSYVNKVGPSYRGHHDELPAFAQWLGVAVGDLFDCHTAKTTMSINNGNASFGCVEFFGYKQDVEVAGWTFTYLLECIRKASAAYRVDTLIPAGVLKGAQKIATRSFREGMSQQLCTRLYEIREARTRSVASGSQALVLYENKKSAIEQVFGKFDYTESPEVKIDPSAFSRGQREARNVRLSTPVEHQPGPGRLR
jgi:hypothetical protein